MYEAIVESDETHVQWWVSVNGKRCGESFAVEDDAHLVKQWLNGTLTTSRDGAAFCGSIAPALDDIAAALGVVELPVYTCPPGAIVVVPPERDEDFAP